jgi:hypothetical protein
VFHGLVHELHELHEPKLKRHKAVVPSVKAPDDDFGALSWIAPLHKSESFVIHEIRGHSCDSWSPPTRAALAATSFTVQTFLQLA